MAIHEGENHRLDGALTKATGWQTAEQGPDPSAKSLDSVRPSPEGMSPALCTGAV